MAASSSLGENNGSDRFEVFISFRGDDIRGGFLSHLTHALEAKQINVFVDNKLVTGNPITGSLLRIIEQSDLSIVIFSKHYPDSEYCLEELEKIHECMKQREQIVVPVFYELDPSDVQDLKGNYAVKEQKWRDALVVISNISGLDSANFINDAVLVDDIVTRVDAILSQICPTISDDGGLFGIDSRIEDVVKLLRLDSTDDVRMVGIWGMGGIGKTTLSCKVFDNIKERFGGSCLVLNVRETLSTSGALQLRIEIVQKLLKDGKIRITSAYSIDDSLRRRLKRIKALLVLDDVHTCRELNSLLESCALNSRDSFCPGSRIIVTSRDSQVLRNVKFESDIYEVKQLKNDKALELLSWHAFGQNEPQQGYETISEEVVRHAHGIPLAIVVLACELKHKEIRHWKEALKKFKSITPAEIQKVLRISFDGLDQEEKDIFLDIACFFKRYPRKAVEKILERFGFHSSIGIDRLIDKCLVKDDGGVITMHDLLEQMGQEIVAEEKQSKGQQSRLWKSDDIKDALTDKVGTENVECIYDLYGDHKIDIDPGAFSLMRVLRFLSLDDENIKCPMGLKFLPNSIKFLRWRYYPLKYFPSSYNADKLVVLEMCDSQLKEINWSKPLKNLKIICLERNFKLIRISDLAMAPNLEHLLLAECYNLVEVGASLENLNKLTSIDVSYCELLSHLPELPYSVKKLKLQWSGLRRLPSTVGRLTRLKELSLRSCERLESLPRSISNLPSLKTISLRQCSNLEKLPEEIGNLEALEELDASYTGLRELPPSVQNLNKLMKLNLICCQELRCLPDLPSNLELFYATSLLSEVSSSIIDQYLSKVLNQPTKVHRLCVNGSQVPEWMMYRNECGSSMSLDLETLGHSVNLIFCSVISSNCTFGRPDCSNLEAVIRISETECCTESFHKHPECYLDHDLVEEECNVFLWNCNLDRNSVKKVSFIPALSLCRHAEIIKCGVHPIFHSKRRQL